MSKCLFIHKTTFLFFILYLIINYRPSFVLSNFITEIGNLNESLRLKLKSHQKLRMKTLLLSKHYILIFSRIRLVLLCKLNLSN
jgi:hypothetical protein